MAPKLSQNQMSELKEHFQSVAISQPVALKSSIGFMVKIQIGFRAGIQSEKKIPY